MNVSIDIWGNTAKNIGSDLIQRFTGTSL